MSIKPFSAIPTKIWSASGITEHLGGLDATRHLLKFLPAGENAVILDLGCGTGFTACLLAHQTYSTIFAMDYSFGNLMKARERIEREGCNSALCLFCADANHLPLAKNIVNGIMTESVLVFTDLHKSLYEINRVMKSGGILVDNELTYLSSPPSEMEKLLIDLFGIQTYQKEGWQDQYRRAGFNLVNSSAHKISLIEQMKSHLRVDGLMNYFKAVNAGLADKTIRRTFFNREMLKPFLSFRKYIGYGLYVLKKK